MPNELALASYEGCVLAILRRFTTACYGETSLTTALQEALAGSFPSTSQYVIAMGGTEFPAADVASTNTTYGFSLTSQPL